jgi:hypothetical protein
MTLLRELRTRKCYKTKDESKEAAFATVKMGIICIHRTKTTAARLAIRPTHAQFRAIKPYPRP